MPSDIPTIDADYERSAAALSSVSEEREYLALEAEATFYRQRNRSETQKYAIKWVAVATGIFVIFGMSGMLAHLAHSVFWGPFSFVSPAFSVAIIAAPVASITTITVSLFVGAFRRFEDKDAETVGKGASAASNWLGGS